MKGRLTEAFEKWWSETAPELQMMWDTYSSWVKGHWVEILVVLFIILGIIPSLWATVAEYYDPAAKQRRKEDRQKIKARWREHWKHIRRWKDPNV